ncbi:hypothetical protein TYRP_018412 [Tyrophagus putrescentiae]|nr:hypothetical protein TYRP_018412 [Tyrophagus putrescentiae]
MADEVKTWTFGAERKFSDSKENLATNSTSGSISPTVPNSLSSNNCCFNSTKNEAVASPPPPPISPHHPHSHHPHRPDIGDANMPWFHGKITREDAEALLMPRESKVPAGGGQSGAVRGDPHCGQSVLVAVEDTEADALQGVPHVDRVVVVARKEETA